MATVLMVYGTTEGHTRKIARFVRELVREAGHEVWIADATELFGVVRPGEYDLIMVAASVHEGRHQRPVEHFVRDSLEALKAATSALLSVSLNAALEDAPHRAEAQRYVDALLAATDWEPDATLLVGGAVRFGKYDFFRRQVLSFLLPRTVGERSEEGDVEFTDYSALRRFVLALLGRFEPVPAGG